MNMENEESSVAVSAKPSEDTEGWIESVIITVSQTSVGQTILKLVDRFLWVVEKSAQWSLPCQDIAAEENGKSFGTMKLVRPLPWIFFLPGLVILRAIRGGLNVGAFVLGFPQIQPSGMVKFVQKGRRRLRALNLKAVKSIRRKTYTSAKDKRLSMIEAKKALITSIRLTLSTLSCLDTSKSSPSPPPTKIRIGGIDLETTATPEEKSTTESAGSPMHTDTKRKFSEISTDETSVDESENEMLQSKIERLALEDSIDDPDFNPADCSTESSTGSSENEADMNISLSEIEDVKKDAQSTYVGKTNRKQEPQDIKKEEAPKQKPSSKETGKATRAAEPQNTEEETFHSPMKFGQDGDTTFYSPISSKSGSPERSLSPSVERDQQRTGGNNSNDFINGEINFCSGSASVGITSNEVNNGVVIEKRNANTGKFHHKGKRSSHGNRKKK